MKAGRRTTLDVRHHDDRAVHGRARQPRRVDGDARDPRRPRRVDRGARVDRQRVHADVRRLPPDRRRARRPLRAEADVHDRHRRSSRPRPRCGRARSVDRLAHRRPRGPGDRRRDRHAAHADDPERSRLRRAARRSRSAPGRASRDSRSRMGPLVGGAVVEGISWQWIFWLNVPIGLVLLPLATQLRESYGPDKALDLPGLGARQRRPARARLGARERERGRLVEPADRRRARRRAPLLLAAFVAWELRTPEPMLPMRFFRNRAFSAANGASLFMYFGMFGSIFLLTQFFQTAQGYSPLESGLRVLPWTAMPMIVAPIAGALSDRIGGGRIMATGLVPAGDRPGVDRGRLDARPSATRRSSARSSSPGSGWGCSSRRSRTSCSPRFGRVEEGKASRRQQRDPRGRRRVRRRRARVALRALRRLRVARRPSTTASCRRSGSARRSSAPARCWPLLIPPKREREVAEAEPDGDLASHARSGVARRRWGRTRGSDPSQSHLVPSPRDNRATSALRAFRRARRSAVHRRSHVRALPARRRSRGRRRRGARHPVRHGNDEPAGRAVRPRGGAVGVDRAAAVQRGAAASGLRLALGRGPR